MKTISEPFSTKQVLKLKTRSEIDCTFLVYVPSIIVDKQFWFIDFQFNHIVGVEKIRPVGRIQPATKFPKEIGR